LLVWAITEAIEKRETIIDFFLDLRQYMIDAEYVLEERVDNYVEPPKEDSDKKGKKKAKKQRRGLLGGGGPVHAHADGDAEENAEVVADEGVDVRANALADAIVGGLDAGQGDQEVNNEQIRRLQRIYPDLERILAEARARGQAGGGIIEAEDEDTDEEDSGEEGNEEDEEDAAETGEDADSDEEQE
jgi:hypothetical protein